MPRGDISHRDLSPLRWRRAYLAVVKASGLHPGMPARVACDRARMGPAIADVTRKGLAPISLSARPLLSVRRAGGLTFWLACTVLTSACAELPGTPHATELFRPPSEVVSSCTAYRHASDAAQSAHSDGVDWHCEPNPEFWVTPASAQSRPLLLEGQLGLDLLEDLARGGLSARHRQASVALHRIIAGDRNGFRPFAALDRGQHYTFLFPERADTSQPQVRRILRISPPPSQPIAAWPPHEAHGVPLHTEVQHFLFRAEADVPDALRVWSPDAPSPFVCTLFDDPKNPFRGAARIGGDQPLEGHARSCALPSPMRLGRYRFEAAETTVQAFSTWHAPAFATGDSAVDGLAPAEDEAGTSENDAPSTGMLPGRRLFDETMRCSVNEVRVGPLCLRPGSGRLELRARTLEPVLAHLEIPRGAPALWAISAAGHLTLSADTPIDDETRGRAQRHSGRVTLHSLNFPPAVHDFTFENTRAPSSVQVVEIMANPAGDDALGEFVILKNFGKVPVDLQTLYLTDTPTREVPSLGQSYLLLPGAAAALVPTGFDPTLLRFRPDVQATLYLEGSISHRGLVNTGGSLLVMERGGDLLDTFVFGASGDDVCWIRSENGGSPQQRPAGQCRYVYPREATP